MSRITHAVSAGVACGVLLLAGAAPAAAAPDGPILSGTYNVTANYGSAVINEVVQIASGCPQCDATLTGKAGAVNMTWNGVAWENVAAASGCGPFTTVYTPLSGNGIVQSFAILGTYLTPEVCAITGPVIGTGNRISD